MKPTKADRLKAKDCLLVFSEKECSRIAQALSDERERCANVAENSMFYGSSVPFAKKIAKAIREME